MSGDVLSILVRNLSVLIDNLLATSGTGIVLASNQMLKADVAGPAVAFTVPAARLVGRGATGAITALTGAEVITDILGSSGTYAEYIALASTPDVLVAGAITRDASGAATSAPLVWPNGQPGTYTATVLSSSSPGAVDSYTVTYGSPITRTYTQPTVTRDATGAVSTRPAVTVA